MFYVVCIVIILILPLCTSEWSYAATTCTSLLLHSSGTFDGITLFSPRTVENLSDYYKGARSTHISGVMHVQVPSESNTLQVNWGRI